MPTYNREKLIGESITSVVNQTYQHWELIIVDDGSTDNTAALVRHFSDPRIKFHAYTHSGRFGVARNRGIALAKGDLIAFLDSDDLWEPGKLAAQVDTLIAHPESYFVFANVLLFGNTSHQAPSLPDLINRSIFLNIWNEDGVVFYPSTLLFRKTALITIGNLNEESVHGADLDFLFALSESFKGCFLGSRWVRIRKHGENTSVSDKVFGYDDSIAHAKKYHDKGSLPAKIYRGLVARYYYRKGMVYLRHGDNRNASASFLSCCRYKPLYVKAWVRIMQSAI